MFTEELRESLSIAGTPFYSISASGAQTSGTVDMSKFNRVTFVFNISTLGANATVNAYLQQGNLANGTDAANITGGAITAISTANKTATIEVRADQLTGQYVRGVINANAASVVGITPIAACARYGPANVADDSSVAQRIVV